MTSIWLVLHLPKTNDLQRAYKNNVMSTGFCILFIIISMTKKCYKLKKVARKDYLLINKMYNIRIILLCSTIEP